MINVRDDRESRPAAFLVVSKSSRSVSDEGRESVIYTCQTMKRIS